MSLVINIRAILPSQEALDAMGRRRYQHPKVEQTKTKDKTARRWFFRARVDALTGPGQTERVQGPHYLGSVSSMTRKEAEKARDTALAGINQPDVILSSQVLFGSVLDRWLAMGSVRESTYTNYASVVNAHLRPRWGETRMCDITPLVVEEWLIAKAATCTKSMLDCIRLRFSQVWKRAIFWRFTREVCPVFGMPAILRFGKPARGNALPTLPQYHQFLYLLDEPYRSIVVVCTLTGLRISEAMALTVAQLRSDVAVIVEAVNQRTGKIGPLKAKFSGREIPMSHMRGDIAIPADALAGDRPYNVGYFAVYDAIKEAAKTVEIDYEGFGLHTLRRMHNTMFRRQAGDDSAERKMAREQLGQGRDATNDLYYVPGQEEVEKRAAVVHAMRRKVMESVN